MMYSRPLSSYQPGRRLGKERLKQGDSRKTEDIILTVLLHDAQELDNDLGARSNEDLALSSFLGVVDGIERIIQDTSLDHFDEGLRFSDQYRCEVSE
jgi:hypothetical protein